jgi:hypothetical protein
MRVKNTIASMEKVLAIFNENKIYTYLLASTPIIQAFNEKN